MTKRHLLPLLLLLFLAMECADGFSQPFYKIRTLVGGGNQLPNGSTGAGLSVGLLVPVGVAVGTSGQVYFSDGNRILRYDPSRDLVAVIAGTSNSGFSGDGGPVVNAQISSPYGIAIDGAGNLYFADRGNSRVRRIDVGTGTISTVAGNGISGFAGDGGPASSAQLNIPRGVALDASGGLLIADTGNSRIRRVDLASGQISTIAGGAPVTGDGGPASQSGLCSPTDVFAAPTGDIFINDQNCFRVRRIDSASGIISTYVNKSGQRGVSSSYDGRLAADITLGTINGIGMDANGNFLVGDADSGRILEIDSATTLVTSIAGAGFNFSTVLQDINAGDAVLQPRSLTVDASGKIYVADGSFARVVRLTPIPPGGTWQFYTRVIGNGTVSASPPGNPCGTNCLEYPYGTSITLTATPAPGNSFSGWSVPGCAASVLTCTVTVGSVGTVVVTFPGLNFVTVARTGTGTGVVTSSPAGINCGNTCTGGFADYTVVNLTPQADPESVFVGWSNDCSGNGGCGFSFYGGGGQNRMVTARFDLRRQSATISVAVAGSSTGRITSSPTGIDCPGVCSATFQGGTRVSLTPLPDSIPLQVGQMYQTNRFTRWGGACQGSTCVMVAGETPGVATAYFYKRVVPGYASMLGSVIVDETNRGAIFVRSDDGHLLSGLYSQNPTGPASFHFSPMPDPGTPFRLLAASDLDGNGRSDLIFQNVAQTDGFGAVAFWRDFNSSTALPLRTVKRNWDVQAAGDLDGDGHADLVWRYVVPDSPDTGVSYVWFTDGSGVTQVRKRGGAPLSWKLLGVADLNVDGAQDMLYVSPDRQLRALMATPGRTCANLFAGTVPVGFDAVAVRDFSYRGQGDVLLHNATTGELKLMMLDAFGLDLPAPTGNPDDPNASCTTSNLQVSNSVIDLLPADPSWTYFASGKFDLGGNAAIIFRQPDGSLTMQVLSSPGSPLDSVRGMPFTAVGSAPAGFSPVGP